MPKYTNVKVNIFEGQRKKLKSALENNVDEVSIQLDPEDPEDLRRGEGGFLGMLAGLTARALPLLATAAKTVLPQLGIGALSGLANAGVQKLMGKGLYLKKGGCVCRVETDGKGLYLDPVNGSGLRLFGDGLYLKQGNKAMDDRGLILGPNSPFRNIPILGMIL